MTKSEILCEWMCSEYNLYHCDFDCSGNWIICKELEIAYKYIGDYGIKTSDGRRVYTPRQLKKYLKTRLGNENGKK